MTSIGDYNKIILDRNIFNQIVYTPLSDALRILEERQKDPRLMKKIEKLFRGEVAEILKNKKCAVIARQIATPNHESRMFISIAKENDLTPVFFEYLNDKFSSKNKYKHSLGQLKISNYLNKKGDECIQKLNIIDFNKYDGEKLKNIKTLWEEPLFNFHRKLFNVYGLKDLYFHDESEWYKKNNINQVDFAYYNFFLLFICFGILFENFLLLKDDNEGLFTRDVVLPALEKVINVTGLKPLIVPIETIDLETDDFWYYHLPSVKDYIKKEQIKL